MSNMRFTEAHEWVRVEGDVAVVGISNYAQEQLGDVVFVELPDVGADFSQAEQAAVIESVKAASEIYAPISGEVTEVNEALDGTPEPVNGDSTGEGWLFKMKASDVDELDGMMDEAAYKTYLDGLE